MKRFGVVLLGFVLGCDELLAPGSGHGKATGLPADPGVLVATVDEYSHAELVWGRTTGALYFPSAVPYAFGARRYQFASLRSGETAPRVIRDSVAHSLFSIAVSPDEDWAFVSVTSGSPSAPTLYRIRVSDGETAVISPTLNTGLADSRGATSPAIVSPDGKSLAYSVGPDSLFVYAPATGTSRFVSRGCLALAAFSPTSDAVICAPGYGSVKYRIVHLATGDTTHLVAPNADVLFRPMHFRWDASGIHVVYLAIPAGYGNPDVAVADLETQTVRVLPALPDDGVVDDHVSWSADGSTIAYWRWACLDFGWDSCDAQYRLSVVNMQDSTVRRGAVVNSTSWMSKPVVSPTGDSVAYRHGGSIYVKKLSPP